MRLRSERLSSGARPATCGDEVPRLEDEERVGPQNSSQRLQPSLSCSLPARPRLSDISVAPPSVDRGPCSRTHFSPNDKSSLVQAVDAQVVNTGADENPQSLDNDGKHLKRPRP